MLRLIIGKAGSGKTAAIIQEITKSVDEGTGKAVMIVPEQYSHEAERELCRACGDRLSLYAEVLSFTALARRSASKHGGAAEPWLDKGGRLLCMTLALQNVATRLHVYGAAQRRPDLQSMLLEAIDELKTACIGYDRLMAVSEQCPDALGEKLADLALIAESFDAVVANGHADPVDRLSVLARQIEENGFEADTRVYVDGFIDFTRQQLDVLNALLRRGTDLCVCLTVDSISGDNEMFELSRRAGRALADMAKDAGAEIKYEHMDEQSSKDEALRFYAENMFSYAVAEYKQRTEAIKLLRCESITAECEQAAALCIELVRERGCRWRDIAVVARGYEDYRASLEAVFDQYGVPLFTARRSDLAAKPLPALISLAYDITNGLWATDDVISYMRTGLTGLSADDCDELEDYIFKWQLQGKAWLRRSDWKQHPEGYGNDMDEYAKQRLAHINELRRRISSPLLKFAEAQSKAQTALEHARALAELLEELNIPAMLTKRARELEDMGESRRAAEYRQLWDLTVSALEQCAAIIGSTSMSSEEFSKLFLLMLSKYDIGTIPVSLDRVSAGDFDRNRRRSIKHLIVLGATDNRLPKTEEEAGVFSADERQRLLEMDIDLSSGGDSELWREFSLIYTCLTMPSESLSLLYSVVDIKGAEQRPALIYNRARDIFSLEIINSRSDEVRSSAQTPALILAAHSIYGRSEASSAAAEYFSKHSPRRFASLEKAANMTRGRLSSASIEKLYGKRLKLSASRIDKFASCSFAYFCQYGLKAKPYVPAEFKPIDFGSFIHFVLENTASEAKRRGGFKNISENELRKLTDSLVSRYIKTELNDFGEKSPRFIYLFKRMCADVYRIVEDTAEELRHSDFEPLSFELDFSAASELPPVEIGKAEDNVNLSGKIDRVDGWYHDGKLYIRVVDYKTGSKKFSMSDVWYGLGLQMLLYLFALEDGGEALYGTKPTAAGVMYVPARTKLLSLSRNMSNEEIDSERKKLLRRSGLVLDDEALRQAWENSGDKRYIPLVFRGRAETNDTFASAERLGRLKRHIQKELEEMAKELKSGSVAADPWYKGQKENACMNCDYYSACHFSDGENGESCRFTPKLTPNEVWSLIEECDNNGDV